MERVFHILLPVPSCSSLETHAGFMMAWERRQSLPSGSLRRSLGIGLHDSISRGISKQILVMTENLHFVRGLAFKGFALSKSSTERATGHRWSVAINVTGFPCPQERKL